MSKSPISETQTTDNFRNQLGNTGEEGKRQWIYPKIIKGKFYRYRSILSYFFLAALFLTPFIHINGRPFMLFNIIERKFILFGVPFWPQDFILFGLAMLTVIVSVVLFTAVYGRIFCGWICPQTIFLEMVFRKIENWIEGNANKQKKLAAMPWNQEKILKKGTKHTIFFIISFLISNTFLAYVIGRDALLEIITANPVDHIGGLAAMLAFSIIFYLVFSKMRELVCIWACPYGRLQGVLLDRDSIVVAYDDVRGEPRGKIRKNDPTPKGDCVDCGLCVDVCPTGIDIRNGTQLECVNCTACIDACDDVMVKVKRPTGLIRYASLEGIKSGKSFHYNMRMKAYTGLLILLMGVFVFLLATRDTIEATVLRAPGKMYQQTETTVTNIYNFELVNKTYDEVPVTLSLENLEGAKIVMVGTNGDDITVDKEDVYKGIFFIEMPKENIKVNQSTVYVNVMANGEKIDRIKSSFLAPVKINK
jgi:cytochrome c oxidase accessory protein FixG